MIAMTRREQKREATRDQILAAAAALFAARGYDATTVDEITEAANVAKGTLYYHFQTKDELLVSLIRDAMGQAGSRALEALDGGASPLRVLHDFLADRAVWSEQNRHLMPMPMSLSLGPGQTGEAKEGEASFRRLTAQMLAAGQAAGEVRADLDPLELAQMLAMVYMQALIAGLADVSGGSLLDRVERSFRVFLEGAATGDTSHG
jgi:TetR/AcrR family transcriptional regulator, cholesterol catabolism regulator